MRHGYALCPTCGKVIPVDLVDNGVGMVWHGVHCGWGQTGWGDEEVYPDEEQAHVARQLREEHEADRRYDIEKVEPDPKYTDDSYLE